MYHVSTQVVDERMINVHDYIIIWIFLLPVYVICAFPRRRPCRNVDMGSLTCSNDLSACLCTRRQQEEALRSLNKC